MNTETVLGFVFSNICDVARNLGSLYKRNFPDAFVEYLRLPQNSTSPAVGGYMAAELRRLATGFEHAFELPVTDTALEKSIETYNALRSRLRAPYAFRIEEPQKLSTTELYVAQRAAAMAPPEESLAWLDTLLSELPLRTARPRGRLRVVVEGAFCEQPPLGLLPGLALVGAAFRGVGITDTVRSAEETAERVLGIQTAS